MIVYHGCLKPKVCKCSLWKKRCKGGSDSHEAITHVQQICQLHMCDANLPFCHIPKVPCHWNAVDSLAVLLKKKKRVLHFVIRCIDLLVVFIRRCLSCCGLKVTTTLRLAVVFNNVQVVPGVPRKYIPTASRWLSASNGWLAIWVSEQLTGYRCT